MTFVQWLLDELDNRNMKRSDLARATGMSDTAFTLVINGKRKPGVDMCTAIAAVFKIPPEIVYRQAGLLPPEIDNPPNFDELKYWFTQMTDAEQESFLAQGRVMVEIRNKRPKGRRQPSPTTD